MLVSMFTLMLALSSSASLAAPLVRGAQLRAPDPALKLDGNELVATPPPGHHFNIQAPSTLANGNAIKVKPSSAQERELKFSIESAKPGHFLLSAYLCDDAKTFCEIHRLEASWDGKQLTGVHVAPATTETAPEYSASGSVELDKDGFFVNQMDAALARAKKEGKPLLIDFYGIWCPPCNDLDENVYSSAEFREKGARFVKLKLDADSPASWKLKSKFKIGGYPTIVFASAEGEEIRRIVGSRSRPVFVKEMEKAWVSRKSPFPLLKARADRGDAAAAGLVGRIYLERKEFAPAAQYLKKDPSSAEALADAQIGLAEEKKTANLPDLLESTIAKYPKSPDSVDRRVKLAGIYEEKKEVEKQKMLLTGAIQAASALIAEPKALAEIELTAADLWQTIAEAREALGNAGGAQEAWKSAADEYKKYIHSDSERGHSTELAYCLWKSGDFDGATKIYAALEGYYPKEFTYYYGHANMELERKKFKDALPISRKAYEFSYGDNRLRAGLQLAKILKGAEKKAEAKSVITETLKGAQVPQDESIRTHRYVKSLREFEKGLI
jgi:thioredoxin-like negative regulator of GroEL